MSRRIYTIAGRAGVVILTDSKKKENGNGSMYKFQDEHGDTQLTAIKALNQALKPIPRPNQMRFEQPVVFLLPRFLEFLRYEDTRKVWASTNKKKKGDEIAPELLEQVKLLDEQVRELGSNLQLFGQQRLTSQVFRQYRDVTWKLVDKEVPAPERVSAMEAY